MTDNKFKYWVFLSYSPQDNLEKRPGSQDLTSLCWGDWLNEALKTFSVPAEFAGQINGRGEIIPDAINSIYRDEQELANDAVTLSADTRRALEQSRCLVVICSPRSAKSLQVNEAVRYFKQLGRDKYVLPIVIAGEPNASNRNQPGMSPESECLVPALRHPVRPDGTIDATQRASRFALVDARHGVDKREVLANDHGAAKADLEMAKVQLIALLLGVGFGGLWWREQQRHFFDLAAAQHQAREALDQVEEARRQLQATQRQLQEAQTQALQMQNLPQEIHGQIQEAQSQAQAAQHQAREVQKQLQESQNKLHDAQSQLEEARRRAGSAESKFLEAQNQVREIQSQLEENRRQTRTTQDKLLAAQSQAQKSQDPGWNTRRFTKVFALLAVLALLTADIALRQRKVTSQTEANITSEEVQANDLAERGWGLEQIRQMLQNIGGAAQCEKQQRNLDYLAAGIPSPNILEALKAAVVIVNDQQRSHFQKWLLVRLGWANPMAAMTNACAIEGKIVNDAGLSDSNTYFQLAVLDNWMKTDLPGAFRWVCKLSDADAQQRALEKIINWLQSQPNSELKSTTLESCIEELAKTDVPKALALAESLGVWHSAIITRLWMESDPFPVWNWIHRLNLPPTIIQVQKNP